MNKITLLVETKVYIRHRYIKQHLWIVLEFYFIFKFLLNVARLDIQVQTLL